MNIFLTIPGCISPKGVGGMRLMICPGFPSAGIGCSPVSAMNIKKGRVIPNWLTLLQNFLKNNESKAGDQKRLR